MPRLRSGVAACDALTPEPLVYCLALPGQAVLVNRTPIASGLNSATNPQLPQRTATSGARSSVSPVRSGGTSKDTK